MTERPFISEADEEASKQNFALQTGTKYTLEPPGDLNYTDKSSPHKKDLTAKAIHEDPQSKPEIANELDYNL